MASRKQSQAAQSITTPTPNLPERERERATAYLAAVVELGHVRAAERAADVLRSVATMMQEQADEVTARIAAIGDAIKEIDSEAEAYREPFDAAFARLQDADRLVVEAQGESVLCGEGEGGDTVPGTRVVFAPSVVVAVTSGSEAWPSQIDEDTLRRHVHLRTAELTKKREQEAKEKAQQAKQQQAEQDPATPQH